MNYKEALFKVIEDRPNLKMHILHIFLSAGTTIDDAKQDDSFNVDWEFMYKEVVKVANEIDLKNKPL